MVKSTFDPCGVARKTHGHESTDIQSLRDYRLTAEGTARLAAADADEWAGEGVTPIRPSDTFPLNG